MERERGILKFGLSLWHTDKHGVLLTSRERETEREREREREIFKSFIYSSSAWKSSVFYGLLCLFWLLPGNCLNSDFFCWQ